MAPRKPETRGGLRWPAELYRLNGSLAEGIAAMQMLTGKLDALQGQVQGTMCADEVCQRACPTDGQRTG